MRDYEVVYIFKSSLTSEDIEGRLERYHVLVVDEVGYLPLERQAANLLFALVARRYERGSIIVTSNRGFEQWGDERGTNTSQVHCLLQELLSSLGIAVAK